LYAAIGIVPSWWVCGRGVDVFERNGEVYNEKVEVIDAPVCELLSAYRLYFVAIVEGVPELADDKEIFALDEALFDRSGNTFSCFFLVAIICGGKKLAWYMYFGPGSLPQAPSNNR
jgi:hypothetical protein